MFHLLSSLSLPKPRRRECGDQKNPGSSKIAITVSLKKYVYIIIYIYINDLHWIPTIPINSKNKLHFLTGQDEEDL